MSNEEKVTEILKSHGIKMEIGGCGCCGSPWVTFEYNGETICKDEDYFDLDMISKSDSKDDGKHIAQNT